jgi:eukaryotic-like serine/threonine-protein kinase
MNPEKWRKIKAIFNEAVELAPAEWESVFNLQTDANEEILAEVRKLLAAEQSDNFAVPIADVKVLWQDEAVEDFIGKQIGDYRIISEIGRGGMGIVFEALREKDDFSQIVALKLLKRGMDSDAMLRRFRSERQILASLEHPNIARLLDGGMSADGLPYFAMEFVKGKPLDEFCGEKNLPTNDRLQLFRQICAAISFAHSRLVVHRDLKPSNIFVTEDGTVKLLDFGIAKIISSGEESANQTVTALGMMTPRYASPEQIKGEIASTSSDIYSLGLILYELLTGAPAYHFPTNRLDEIARIICEVEPVRPSSVTSQKSKVESQKSEDSAIEAQFNAQKSKIKNQKSLRGDLDNIILKALRKEPIHRYASVEKFSDDVRRYLEGLPVAARPATLGYRASKFIGRNPLAAASGALAAFGVVGGVTATIWQSFRANRQKQLAERRFDEVRQLARNVLFKYHDAIADLPGSTAARQLLIKDASEYLDNLARETYGDLELEEELAAAYKKVADVQGRVFQPNLGDSQSALANYRKSLEIYRRLAARRPHDAEILHAFYLTGENYSMICTRLAYWEEAQEAARESFAISRLLMENDPSNEDARLLFYRCYIALGESAEFAEGYEGTIRIYREGLQHAAEILRHNPTKPAAVRLYATTAQRIGTQLEYWCDDLREQGIAETEIKLKLDEALKMHFEALQVIQELNRLLPNNANLLRSVAAAVNNVGSAYARLGDGAESLRYTRDALEKFQQLADVDSNNQEARRDVADGFQYVAMSYEALDKPEIAVENYEKALEYLNPIAQKDSVNYEFVEQTHEITNSIGDLEIGRGNYSRAVDFYQTGLNFIEKQIAATGNQESLFLRTVSLEKLGDSFVWLIKNLPNADRQNKNFFAAQARNFYQLSLNELRNLEKTRRLSRTHFYKIELLERKLSELRKI